MRKGLRQLSMDLNLLKINIFVLKKNTFFFKYNYLIKTKKNQE